MQKERVRFWIVFIILLVISVAFCVQKEDFFADEMAQYGLSNSFYNPFLRTIYDGNLNDRVISGQELLDYIVVPQEHRFAYDSVYYNQTQDVHPPFYYFVTHTISSVFYGSFSKWTGLIPNVWMFAAMLVLLYKVATKIFSDSNMGILMILLYGTSTSAVSNYTMIRMYMPLALFTLLLAYEILLLLSGKHAKWLYVAVMVTIFLGMLTQYFYLFYAFFVCAAIDLYWMFHKEWKNCLWFSLFALAGVALMVLCYPYVLTSLVGQSNLSVDYSLGRIVRSLLQMVLYLGRGMLLSAIVTVVSVIVMILFHKNIKAPNKEWVILVVPAILAFLVISLIGPLERYAFHLTAFIVLFEGYFIWNAMVACKKFGNVLSSNVFSAMYIVVAFLIVSFVYQPNFLYKGASYSYDVAREYKDSPCVFMNGANEEVGIVGNLIQMSYFKDICLQWDPRVDAVADYIESHENNEHVVIYIAEKAYADTDEEELAIIMDKLSKEYNYTLIRFGDYVRMYLLEEATN